MNLELQADYTRAFKEADIRGVYPTEIDDEVVYFTARAFVEEGRYTKIIVARDMRESSPYLHAAFIKGATDSGADVIDIGLMHSPGLYFASGSLDLPGVMITASHSPKEYNGLKLVKAGAVPLTETDGLKQIRRRIEKGMFVDAKKTGKVTKKDISTAWQRFVLKGVSAKAFSGMKIVADAGNGMAGVLLPLIEQKLAAEFDVLFPRLDGTFPSRGSDPTLKKNQINIQKKLQGTKTYDLGISFDGDADRIAFFDETGKYINSAVIGALVARHLLQSHPKAKIGYTVLTSRAYVEAIKNSNGKPVLMKVGHAFIKKAMREKSVLFACEHSGHFYYQDYFYTDSVVRTLLIVLTEYQAAKKRGLTVSQMVKPLACYQQTEDKIIEVADKKLALQKTAEYLLQKNPLQLNKYDGYSVDFGDVWGVVKPSVTEFALKVMFESKSAKHAKNVQKEVLQYIQKIAKG